MLATSSAFFQRLEELEERFLWGSATAAYQIEGATSLDGRGPSIWDTFSAIPSKISHNDNGNIADGSYSRYKEDIKLMQDMGLTAYRFSISWTRIMPLGYGTVNKAGIDHYNAVIDELLSNGIEPIVTLYHWDLPQGLEDKYKGLLDAQFEDDFKEYAIVCFEAFG